MEFLRKSCLHSQHQFLNFKLCLHDKHDIENICTLSANMKFICASLETGREASFWGAFHSCFRASTKLFYISWQCTYIVCILQSHVCKKLFDKSKKQTLNIVVKFPMESLQCYLYLTSVYCALLYTRHRVPVDFIRICSTCRKHFPVHSSFMTYHRVYN